MTEGILVKRALLSVSDKAGLTHLAKALVDAGIELLSTGGTAKTIKAANLPVIDVSTYTGFPEMMDGRVKTLHPKIHGGLLGRRDVDNDVMQAHDISPIDLVVCNLYPFQETISDPACDLAKAIEHIDIGGPAMIRSAAKNHNDAVVLTSPRQYDTFIEALQLNQGCIPHRLSQTLAVEAFTHTAQYDAVISRYLAAKTDTVPEHYVAAYQKKEVLRYGENAHQHAVFYTEASASAGTLAKACQHQGKALSYNNIADSDAALQCVNSFDEPACVIVKHANPCGIAVAETMQAAYLRAFQTDPTSSFGGIIAFNRELDETTAKTILDNQFVEVIVAPTVSSAALKILSAKKNCRVLAVGEKTDVTHALDYKKVMGGLLVQDCDLPLLNESELKVVSKREPTAEQRIDLLFAWHCVKYIKSNAIVFAKDNATVGIGAGQMSRVDSVKIALRKAEEAHFAIAGTVMASDAFFPFRDAIDSAAEQGVSAIIQPGGSIRDEEVIQAANEHNIVMLFTSMRHFRH